MKKEERKEKNEIKMNLELSRYDSLQQHFSFLIFHSLFIRGLYAC